MGWNDSLQLLSLMKVSVIYLLPLRFQCYHLISDLILFPDLLSSWYGMGFTMGIIIWEFWFFFWQSEIASWTYSPLHRPGTGFTSTKLSHGLLMLQPTVPVNVFCSMYISIRENMLLEKLIFYVRFTLFWIWIYSCKGCTKTGSAFWNRQIYIWIYWNRSLHSGQSCFGF